MVTKHAQRLIVQFMAASCGKSNRSENMQEEFDEATQQPQLLPENTVPLQRVHELLDKMAQKDELQSDANGTAFADPEKQGLAKKRKIIWFSPLHSDAELNAYHRCLVAQGRRSLARR